MFAGQRGIRRFSPLPTGRVAPFAWRRRPKRAAQPEGRSSGKYGQAEEGQDRLYGGEQDAEDGEVGYEGDQDQA